MDDKLLRELFESLSREIGSLREDMNDGFNRIETRLALPRRLDKLEGKYDAPH